MCIRDSDKPMLQAIGNEELQKYYRNTLKPFYGALKSKDGCIKPVSYTHLDYSGIRIPVHETNADRM